MARKRPPTAPSPGKPYYKIGEVAKLVGVEPHVLRFWERQLGPQIKPERSPTNQRRYRRQDVETFLRFKGLRYDEKLQVKGARRRLRAPSLWRTIADELHELIALLDEDERRSQ